MATACVTSTVPLAGLPSRIQAKPDEAGPRSGLTFAPDLERMTGSLEQLLCER
jgi:hypothetical protein